MCLLDGWWGSRPSKYTIPMWIRLRFGTNLVKINVVHHCIVCPPLCCSLWWFPNGHPWHPFARRACSGMIWVDWNYRHWFLPAAGGGAYHTNISKIAWISSKNGGDQRIQLWPQLIDWMSWQEHLSVYLRICVSARQQNCKKKQEIIWETKGVRAYPWILTKYLRICKCVRPLHITLGVLFIMLQACWILGYFDKFYYFITVRISTHGYL